MNGGSRADSVRFSLLIDYPTLFFQRIFFKKSNGSLSTGWQSRSFFSGGGGGVARGKIKEVTLNSRFMDERWRADLVCVEDVDETDHVLDVRNGDVDRAFQRYVPLTVVVS